MPYANNNGVKIYYEVEGEGPPLMLAHGGLESLNMWKRAGYVDALKNNYQLILFDFRGLGRSDKPHNPSAYGPSAYEKLADDVISVLDTLKISKTHYYGYSMGARTGYQLAVDHPNRFDSFILGSFSPFEMVGSWAVFVKTGPQILRLFLKNKKAVVSLQEQNLGHTFSTDERNNYLASLEQIAAENDLEAVIASSEFEYIPLTVDEVKRIEKPCLIYCGDADDMYSGAKKAAALITQSTFVTLPGYDHLGTFSNIKMILPHIKEFLAQVSKK
jgi:pimeloyl-ACP methyl ester carboxylesterase